MPRSSVRGFHSETAIEISDMPAFNLQEELTGIRCLGWECEDGAN